MHSDRAISITLLTSTCCLVSSEGVCSVAVAGAVAAGSGAAASLFSSEDRIALCSSKVRAIEDSKGTIAVGPSGSGAGLNHHVLG